MTICIDPAGREATIDINERMGVDDIDHLIRGLSQLRRRMLPEVTAEPEGRPDAAPEQATALRARIRLDGACDLWIRDTGLGWITCHLPVAAVVILQDGFRLAVSSLPLDNPIELAFDSAIHAGEEW